MCVTTAVEGRLTLRGDRTKDLSHLLTAEVSQKSLQDISGRSFMGGSVLFDRCCLLFSHARSVVTCVFMRMPMF